MNRCTLAGSHSTSDGSKTLRRMSIWKQLNAKNKFILLLLLFQKLSLCHTLNIWIKKPSSGYIANFPCLLAVKATTRKARGKPVVSTFFADFKTHFQSPADTLSFYLDFVIIKNQEKRAMVLIGYYFIALTKKPDLRNAKNPTKILK